MECRENTCHPKHVALTLPHCTAVPSVFLNGLNCIIFNRTLSLLLFFLSLFDSTFVFLWKRVVSNLFPQFRLLVQQKSGPQATTLLKTNTKVKFLLVALLSNSINLMEKVLSLKIKYVVVQFAKH